MAGDKSSSSSSAGFNPPVSSKVSERDSNTDDVYQFQIESRIYMLLFCLVILCQLGCDLQSR